MRQKITWNAFLIAILMSVSVFGQNTELIWLPVFSYSWEQTEQLGFDASASAFNSLSNLDNSLAIKFIETALIASYATSPKIKLGLGYLHRFATPLIEGYQYEHRLLENISFSSFFGDKKIGHRFVLEQRFRTNKYENRVRYRLSHKFSVGEETAGTFLKLENELLNSFNSESFKGENRFKIAYSKSLKNKKEIEIGIQHRTLNLFTDFDLGQIVLLSTKFSLSK